MKAWMIGGLCVAMGLAAARGWAEDLPWRPAGSTPAFQRVAAPISLSRPAPAPPTDVVQPAGLLDRATPVFRAKNVDLEEVPQLMPLGPAPAASKQPGVAKPMTFVKAVQQPQPLESFVGPEPGVGPEPQVTTSDATACPCPPRRFGILAGRIGSFAGDILGDCGETAGTCCTETCTPCWGSRWRQGWCDDPCCGPRARAWVRGDYLLWGISDQHVPALLTGEFSPIRDADAAGVLPIAPLLFGEDEASEDARSGGRVSLGFWFPRRGRWGMDASFFMLAPRTQRAEVGSDAAGNPVLARPYFQPAFGGVAAGEAAQLVAYPGLVSGKFSYESVTRLWGLDAHLRRKLYCGPRYWLDGFIGYRHLQLADTIEINEDITNLQFAPGTDTRQFLVHDHFATRNMFNGGQIGLEGELRFLRRWFVGVSTKVAVGNVYQTINIDGTTTFVDSPAGTVRGAGGLFALASNIGRYEHNEIAVVPEFGIKLGFDVTDHLRVYAGYNVLYMSSVVRAGEQIDRTVNFVGMAPEPTNLTPGVVAPARPAVLFRQSDFWAQGAQFGVEYHW